MKELRNKELFIAKFEDNVELEKYDKEYFTCWLQLREIRLGLKERLDVSVYAKEEYSWQQMKQIRIGLSKKLDVSIYAKPEYNQFQMRELRYGLSLGLDVSKYANKELYASQMREIRLGLIYKVDISKYATKIEMPFQEMEQIRISLMKEKTR